MRRLLAFWKKEWLALARDVHGLAVLFLMPAAFIVIMSLALSDAFTGDPGRSTDFAVLGPGDAKLAEQLSRSLAGGGFRATPAPADEAAARDSVRRGSRGLVLVVPPGFAQTLGSVPDPKVEAPALVLLADPTLPPTQLVAFQQRVLGATLGARMSAIATGVGFDADPGAFDLKRAASLAVEVVGNPRSGRPSSVQQNVPAWLIFGMFLVVMPISSLFIVERREGTLARLVSQQVPFSMLLLGKVGPFFVVNMVQAALMLLAGRYVVPWFGGEALVVPPSWDLLAAVIASTSVAAIGWGLAVAVFTRTSEQAIVVGGVGTILVAAIGGIMVPRFVMPESMHPLVDLSPMAWALEAFHAVILRHGGWADIAAPCARLVALGAALLLLALLAHHRRRA
jgi:ABC-2 type transport system permease protein